MGKGKNKQRRKERSKVRRQEQRDREIRQLDNQTDKPNEEAFLDAQLTKHEELVDKIEP